ncbi:hypothetical protein Tco_0662576 [Tanacetum coccineum]
MLEAHDEQAPNLHSEPLEEQAPNSYAKEYYDMLEADDEPLYEGCEKYSTLEAATRESTNYETEDGTGWKIPESSWGSSIPIGDGDGDGKRFPNGDGDGDEDEAHK